VLEYIALGVDNLEQVIGVKALAIREDNWLDVPLHALLLQVVEELAHAFSLVDEDGLSRLFQEKFVFGVLRSWVRHIAEILVAKESMHENIVKFKEHCEGVLLRRRWQHHVLVVDL